MFVLTHPENTGVRIFNKWNLKNRDKPEKYLDVIISKVDKTKNKVYVTLKSYRGNIKCLELPIVKNHPTDYTLTTKNGKRKSFFGIQANQKEYYPHEIRIGYSIHALICKGWFNQGEFIRCPRNKELSHTKPLKS